VGVSKVGGLFVHSGAAGAIHQRTTAIVFEDVMKESLSPEQEAQAVQLADRLADASREDFLRIARALVAAGPSPFGRTEFEVRDLVLGIGARAFEQALAQKKTATTGPA
jgi:hypothetical protein